MTPSDAPAPARPDAPLAAALAQALSAAVRDGEPALEPLRDRRPVDRRDRFLALLELYDLHTAPLEQVGGRARFQHAPVLAGLKGRLEADWLLELEGCNPR